MITQKMDVADPILGFFHGWVMALARKFNSLKVICLQKGSVDLPQNIEVFSLGKELGVSKMNYVLNFYKYLWQERNNYDAVFVHMNQEYVLLAGWYWWLAGKKVYMWRNHHAGNWLTDVAAFFCDKVFCTSKFSYTAKYQKTVLMPVGVDTSLFKSDSLVVRKPNSILFLARMSPVKKPDLLIKALVELHTQGLDFSASFYGDPISADEVYYSSLKRQVAEAGLDNKVVFYPGIANNQTPAIYNAHEIFVNLSSSGMYDKTIFEAMACGCLVLVSNENLRGQIDDNFVFKQDDLAELGLKLKQLLGYTREQVEASRAKLGQFAESHSLERLSDKLFTAINHES